MNIIDLAQFKSEEMEIVMLDGTTIHLPKPAYKTFIKLIELESNKGSGAESIKKMVDTIYEVVNTNTEGIAFDYAAIEEYPLEILGALMREYMGFVSGAMQRKNL